MFLTNFEKRRTPGHVSFYIIIIHEIFSDMSRDDSPVQPFVEHLASGRLRNLNCIHTICYNILGDLPSIVFSPSSPFYPLIVLHLFKLRPLELIYFKFTSRPYFQIDS